MDELILVDLDDRPVGYMNKEETHRRGRLHRAFSVFIISGGRMLLQKRSRAKYHSGGLWANACCSHPRKGEELAEAVHRRLREELGMDTGLTELFQFVYRTKFREDLYEYELDHVFLGSYEGEPVCNPEEIEELRWVSLPALKEELVQHPGHFSSWFIIAAPRVMAWAEQRADGAARFLPGKFLPAEDRTGGRPNHVDL